jgi:hypothetical protein
LAIPHDVSQANVSVSDDREIRSDCLAVITRHVIHPLALSIASSRRPSSTTNDQIVELVSSSTVLEAMNRHSSHTRKTAAVKTQTKSPQKKAKSPSPAAVEREAGEHSQSRLVRRIPGNALKQNDAGPSSPRRSAKTKSPSPVKSRTTVTHATRAVILDDDEDESMPPEDQEDDARSPTPVPDPTPSPPRSRKKKASPPLEEDEDMNEEKSPTPPPPSAPSQKTQQEKDEEEEEELAKKRAEMKRRMGAGGGGRLVRRRFG